MLPYELRKIIPGLKEKYGSIYALDVSEFKVADEGLDVILIRAMSRLQFNAFTESFLLDPVEAVRILILTNSFGYEDAALDLMKAGIDEFICSAISTVSGFASEESLAEGVEYGRKYASSLEAAITMYICKAFPKLTPEDVDAMTLETQMRYVAMAEQMLGREVPYMDYLHPKPTKKKSVVPDHVLREPPMQDYQYSYGGQQRPQFERSKQMPRAEEHEEVVVTPDNLQDVIKQSQEIFRGRS